MAHWATNGMADALLALGPIVDDEDKDDLFGDQDDDQLIGSSRDKLKQ